MSVVFAGAAFVMPAVSISGGGGGGGGGGPPARTEGAEVAIGL